MRLVSRSGLIAIVLTVAAIAASTAQASGGFAGIRPVQASTLAQASADQIAAERAALSPSAPLDRFSLIHVHTITPTTTTGVGGTSDSEGFERAKEQALANHVPPYGRYSSADSNAYATPTTPSGGYSMATFNGYGSGHPVSVQGPKSPSANPDNAFDWGDAAIGAAAGLTLTLLVGGGAMLLSRRRSPRGDSANVATT